MISRMCGLLHGHRLERSHGHRRQPIPIPCGILDADRHAEGELALILKMPYTYQRLTWA